MMILEIKTEGKYRHSDSVISREIEEDIFLVRTHNDSSMEEDAGFVLEGVGKVVWNLLDGTNTVAHVIKQVSRQYEAPEAEIATDVVTFLDQLATQGMISE
jgi:hypothetical protein